MAQLASTTDGTGRTGSRRPGLAIGLMATAGLTLCLSAVSLRAATASPAPRYLTPAHSVQLLQRAFGSLSERPLTDRGVVVISTRAGILQRNDEVNIANRAFNRSAGRPWARGDAAKTWPRGLDGFADPATGSIFIGAASAQTSTTAHEVLHVNSSPEFLATFGVDINEGATEQLALDALAVSGIPLPSTAATPYPRERALVADLIGRVGREALVRAYFNGGDSLRQVVATIGLDTLPRVKEAAAGGDARRAIPLLHASAGLPAAAAAPTSAAAPGDLLEREIQ